MVPGESKVARKEQYCFIYKGLYYTLDKHLTRTENDGKLPGCWILHCAKDEENAHKPLPPFLKSVQDQEPSLVRSYTVYNAGTKQNDEDAD